jgi:predicted hydrocarbon binding protein
MALDENGILVVEFTRTLIVPAALFQHLQEAGERFLGRGWIGIVYSAGEDLGRTVAEGMRMVAGQGAPPEVVLQTVFDSAQLRGFGPVQILDLDIPGGRGTVRFLACPFDQVPGAKSRASCPLSAGFVAGVFGALRGKPVFVEEVACISKGEPYCDCTASATRE